MKKNLTLLTGIVFLITILLAGACSNREKEKSSTGEENAPEEVKDDSTKVDIYLNAILIDGSMHLEMYDSKKPGCVVIDGLVTVVYPGYTVTWKKVQHSNIDKVLDIRPINDLGKIFGDGIKEIEPESLWTLKIPDVGPGIVKYEIVFTVNKDTTTWTIDPYLKIPDQ